ncbi:MAG: ABC transporter permease [Pseudomonadota bacterium]
MRGMIWLAARDLIREPVHVLCVISMIAGVLAPLMLLMAIRAGVMENVVGTLRDDPNARRIDIVGNHSFGPAELADLRSWPEVAMAVPQERSIARRVSLRPPGARRFLDVVLVPTAGGDPLLPPDTLLGPREIAVSASLAERADIAVGATLNLRATRGDPPNARLAVDLTVSHILPRGSLQGLSALTPGAFTGRVEAFFDGYALPDLGVQSGDDVATRTERFESFRLFAKDIRDVVALESRVEQRLDVIVRSRAGEIEALLRLFTNVGIALSVLLVCAGLGLAAALTALFWSSVERKQLTLSILALVGAPPGRMAIYPVAQSVMYAVAGVTLSLIVFLVGAAALNTIFADAFASLGGAEGAIVPINPVILAGTALVTVLIALIASSVAAWRAARIEPATVIRSGA